MRWFIKVAVRILLTLGVISEPAGAAIITRTFGFSADSFNNRFYPTAFPPIASVMGSFTVSFDPSMSSADDTLDAKLISLNLPLASAIGVDYNLNYDQLIVGGIQHGVSIVYEGTNDFFIAINHPASATPTYGFLAYGTIESRLFLSQRGTITASPLYSAMPEPGSWGLMIVGFGFIGYVARRRYARGMLNTTMQLIHQ